MKKLLPLRAALFVVVALLFFDIREVASEGSLDLSAPGSYAIVPDTSEINVYDSFYGTVVDFSVSFANLPQVGYRKRIISKFNGVSDPYPGWAFAVKRFRKSVRFQIYLKDILGEGGWHSLGAVRLEHSQAYRFILVFRKSGYFSAYMGKEGELSYLGGAVVTTGDLQDESYQTRLVLGTGRPGPYSFDGVFHHLNVYDLEKGLSTWEEGLVKFSDIPSNVLLQEGIILKGFARWLR